jgi:hypothetical protein
VSTRAVLLAVRFDDDAKVERLAMRPATVIGLRYVI